MAKTFSADIKNVKIIHLKNPKGSMKAVASFSIGPIAFNSWRIMEGAKGVFAGPPSQKGTDKKFYEFVKILDKELYWAVQKAIKEAYEGGASSDDDQRNNEEDNFDDLPF